MTDQEFHLRKLIDQLERENATLRADKERLDWLEKETKKSQSGISFDYVRYVEDGMVSEKGFRFMRHHYLGDRKNGIRAAVDASRAAIDAARKEQP